MTEPRWLTPAERAAWMGLAKIMIKLPGALSTQLERDAGLSFFEYMVLAMLSEQPDRRLRMSDLAALTNASPSRLSHVATRLETQGLIRREPDSADRRSTYAVLTADGMAKVEASAPGHVQEVRDLVIDALTPAQLRGLQDAGERILARVEPHCPAPR
jgi:DNA-binding MarR family transcriptional regulator